MRPRDERHQIRLLIRSILAVIFIVGAFIAWILFQPPPALPKIAFQLNGYTNDFTGDRLAILTITNLTKTPVLAYMPIVLIKDDTQPNGFSQTPRPILAWQAKLKSGQSAMLTIPTDTNALPWKLGLFVYSDIDLAHTLKNFLTLSRQMPFSIKSDWYEPSAIP